VDTAGIELVADGGTPPVGTSVFVRRRPAALAGLVAGYSGYREAGVAPALHRGLPPPSITLILTLDEPLILLDGPGDLSGRRVFDSLLAGLHTTPALVHHDGRQSGIEVSLRPLGIRALLGLPAGALAGADLDAGDVLGRSVEHLRHRLQAAPSWEDRFRLLDAALLARVHRDLGPAPEVVRAWDLLVASRGTVSVAAVARDVGWSARRLRERLEAETGLTTKVLARVIRFDHARRLLQATPAAATGRERPAPALVGSAAASPTRRT